MNNLSHHLIKEKNENNGEGTLYLVTKKNRTDDIISKIAIIREHYDHFDTHVKYFVVEKNNTVCIIIVNPDGVYYYAFNNVKGQLKKLNSIAPVFHHCLLYPLYEKKHNAYDTIICEQYERIYRRLSDIDEIIINKATLVMHNIEDNGKIGIALNIPMKVSYDELYDDSDNDYHCEKEEVTMLYKLYIDGSHEISKNDHWNEY